ncbi:MAG TPA: helix-turn-helix domain-containing protein [Solirubrobacterales bacterium]|jgi:predicted transcriptional regulator|nr:helix-turn-helix domain-containing protein [Solirubrobacterales bacterium]
MGDLEHPDIDRLLKVLRHPLRRRVLELMIDAEPTSPRDLSNELDCTLSTVAYHVRVLAQSGALEMVHTKQVRGSTQHFYLAAIEAPQAHHLLSLAEKPDTGPAGEEIS